MVIVRGLLGLLIHHRVDLIRDLVVRVVGLVVLKIRILIWMMVNFFSVALMPGRNLLLVMVS